MTTDYRHEYMRKQMGKHEIDQMCANYESKCKYLGSHKASKKEITEMLRESNSRMCSYT